MWTEILHNRDKVGSGEDGADLEKKKKGGVNRNEDGRRRDAVLQTLTQTGGFYPEQKSGGAGFSFAVQNLSSALKIPNSRTQIQPMIFLQMFIKEMYHVYIDTCD